jgi:hypothetical protein
MTNIIFQNYQVGTTTSSGHTIKEILFFSEKYIIFLNEKDEFRAEYDEKICFESDKSLAEAGDLHAQLEAIRFIKRTKTKGIDLIASALAHAFAVSKESDSRDFFKDAREFIQTKAAELHQAVYLFFAFFTACYFMLCIRFPWLSVAPSMEWVAGFGALGAFLSVLLRFREIEIRRYTSPSFIACEGMVRVGLGAVFGFVFLILQKANLLLGIASDNQYAIAAFSIIAGMYERFVPELLAKAQQTVALDSSNSQ